MNVIAFLVMFCYPVFILITGGIKFIHSEPLLVLRSVFPFYLTSFLIGYKLLDDPVLGKVSFDNMGVNFHTPLRTIRYLYGECAEIGFTKWPGPGGTAYYIYLSKVKITDEQRDYLFRGRSKRKRGKRNMPLYHSEYLLFQYTNDVFDAFIDTVPSKFRDELIRKKIEMGISVYDRY